MHLDLVLRVILRCIFIFFVFLLSSILLLSLLVFRIASPVTDEKAAAAEAKAAQHPKHDGKLLSGRRTSFWVIVIP